MTIVDGRYVTAVNQARKNLNIAVDELIEAWDLVYEEEEATEPPYTPNPRKTSEDLDTDALVASISGGQSPPAMAKPQPPAAKTTNGIDLDSICAEVLKST